MCDPRRSKVSKGGSDRATEIERQTDWKLCVLEVRKVRRDERRRLRGRRNVRFAGVGENQQNTNIWKRKILN